jgi:membrane protein required for beta-lactamase induction
MTRRDEWVIRLFQTGGLLIFLSGFVFFRWALLIWFMFVLYMTVGWRNIDNWTRHKTYILSRKQKESAERIRVQDS